MIHKQLILLLHANECQDRENADPNGQAGDRCTLAHCQMMKKVLNHMRNCEGNTDCSVTHCYSSRKIIHHWKNCSRSNCPVCSTLNACNNNVKNTSNSFDRYLHATFLPAMQVWHSSTDIDIRNHWIITLCRSVSSNPDPSLIKDDRRFQDIIAVAKVSESGIYSRAQSMCEYTILMINEIEKMRIRFGSIGSYSRSQTSESKMWQILISNNQRTALAHDFALKLAQALFPNGKLDQSIQHLTSYTQNAEKEMFEKANSRFEYYYSIAEKILAYKKDFEEKQLKRTAQQSYQGQQCKRFREM